MWAEVPLYYSTARLLRCARFHVTRYLLISPPRPPLLHPVSLRRSVLIDYVPDASLQRIAIGVMGGVCALTAVGLIKFNLTDEGITSGFKSLWRKPTDAKAAVKH